MRIKTFDADKSEKAFDTDKSEKAFDTDLRGYIISLSEFFRQEKLKSEYIFTDIFIVYSPPLETLYHILEKW